MNKIRLLSLAVLLGLGVCQKAWADERHRDALFAEARQAIRLVEADGADREVAAKTAQTIGSFEARYPDDELRHAILIGSYLEALDTAGSKLLHHALEYYAAHKSLRIKALAEGKLRLHGYFIKPMELHFRSSSDQAVEVANLRSKVVLLIFWSTWCPFCREEVESIKRIYAKHKDEGLEVIGVALEMAPAEGGQNPSQKTLEQFNAYLSANGIAWPNYYDGKLWDTEIAGWLGIRRIPTTILLNRSGLVDSVRLKGDKLKERIIELLKEE